MKKFLFFTFCGFSLYGFGQVNFIMPPEADIFYTKAISTIKPSIKSVIERKAVSLKNLNVNSDSLTAALKSDPLLKGVNQPSLEIITVLIMVQISKNADEELKTLVMKVRKADEQSSNEIAKGSELIIGRKSRIAETVTAAMKKVSFQENTLNSLK